MAGKPTPRPWRVFNVAGVIEIQDAKGEPVVFWQGFDRSDRSRATHLANARLIVEAVNAYGVEVRPVTRQEDQFLHNAAKASAKVVAPGKLAPGVGVDVCPHCKAEVGEHHDCPVAGPVWTPQELAKAKERAAEWREFLSGAHGVALPLTTDQPKEN